MEFTNPKLVINGISTKIDERILRRHYTHSFVTFVDPSKPQIALQQQHIILGRKVEVRPAKPKVEIGKRKIFVGGLPRSITNEEFKGYFEKFGSIVDAVVIHDKETKRSREFGFGFVTYEAEESANLVLRTNFHLLNNKRVEVKKVTPRQEMVPTGHGFPPYYYHPYYQTYFYVVWVPACNSNCYSGDSLQTGAAEEGRHEEICEPFVIRVAHMGGT
ncbi:RNA-binding protein Musashi-like protein Rbp6-like isoform X2 [Gossypium australe]|uniref:RNA-binding protein Musashi-like protein Rbp6-like isoform X2 n=1 Tax=Gossypium australe TaxID=47621 RepID=A0A5B6UU29_9ROSI|nr:RNA-binding protein Musashi-like protein Rbp6-like isoform X2 [Gossypium australe]